MTEKGEGILVAIIGSDQQFPSQRGSDTAKSLDEAFILALDQAAATSAEIEFSKTGITYAWSRRRVELR
jgi:hypothetical protein